MTSYMIYNSILGMFASPIYLLGYGMLKEIDIYITAKVVRLFLKAF